MTELWTVHTADLDARALEAARSLLDDAFDGDFSDHDWENALGGMHTLVW
jgi:aminoglycoside 2'-N-acetyltransferase I